jgi:diguanylate cyclase (GGDEF)-like protein
MNTLIPAELNNQLRTKIYSLAAAVCLILTLGSISAGSLFMAVTGLCFTTLLYANGRINMRYGDQPAPLLLSHLIIMCLITVTLASLIHFPGQAEHWCYMLPLIAYLIYPLRLATTITASFSLALAIAVIFFYRGPEKPQLFFIYLLSLIITLAFVYLREIKEKQLQPLRRTDNLTLASTREYLLQDLHKEVQRSEREGTPLSVLALSFDESTLAHSQPDDKDGLLHRLGRLLHENLRLFDAYYRYNNSEMIIILPHTQSREAMRKAGQLRQKVKQNLSSRDFTVSVSVGLASLNVDDTAQTLIDDARKALKQAQSRDSNQSRTFVELDGDLHHAG